MIFLTKASLRCPRDADLATHTDEFITVAKLLPTTIEAWHENYLLRCRLQQAIALMHGYVEARVATELHGDFAAWLVRWQNPKVQLVRTSTERIPC